MSERKIGLRLQLNGVNQTITSIKDLEKELELAKEDLKELEIGSDLFKELSKEVGNAEVQLKNLNNQAKGLDFNKQAQAFTQFSTGIISGFAGATAALQLFGKDTTEVSKAAAQAQNLLTIAISARGVAEGIAKARIVATTVATAAQTVATNVANISLKALWATMLANPITAVLAGIGLLITALVAFAEKTEDTTKAQRELGKVTSEEAVKLKALSGVIEDVNSTNEERLGAINELKKTYPGFNTFIDKENRLNQDGKRFIEQKTQALILQAQVQKILEKIAENNNKQLEIQNRTVEESLDGWDKTVIFFQRYFTAGGKVTATIREITTAAKNNKEANSELAKENQNLEESLSSLLGQLQKNNESLEEYNKRLDEQAKKEKETADAAEAAERRQAAIFANQRRRNQLLTNELQKRLADLKLAYEQERRAAIKNGEDLLLVDKTYYRRKGEIIKQAQIDISNLTKEVGKELLDVEGKSYKQRIDEVTNFESERRKKLQDTLDELIEAGVATQKEIDETNKAIEQSFQLQESKIIEIQKEINTNYLEGQVNLFNEAAKLQIEFFGTEKQLYDDRRQLFVNNFLKYKETELNKIKLALESADVEQTQIDETLKKYEDYFNKLGLLQLNNSNIQKGFADIDKKQTQLNLDLQIEYFQKIKEAQVNYVNDEKGLKLELAKIESDYQLLLLNLQREALKNKLAILEQDPTLNPEELKRIKAELLKVETEFNNQVKKGQKSVTDTIKQDYDKLLGNIGTGFQELTNTLNQLSSLTQMKFSFMLERMEMDFKNTMTNFENLYQQQLDTIVGDSEEANQRRLEIEIEFGKKRDELEKIAETNRKKVERDAQLSSLRFTLAQTIANGAQAFVNALASLPPPANAIVAAAQGVISAAQIAIVSQQIGFIKSQPLARGGFVRGRSHDQGGVKYQAGGIELEGNEAVINRRSTLKYGPLLSQINESGGGRPLLVNNIMDSRLAEILASVKSEPIRAYVLESEITKSQAVNRRLEELATF